MQKAVVLRPESGQPFWSFPKYQHYPLAIPFTCDTQSVPVFDLYRKSPKRLYVQMYGDNLKSVKSARHR